MTVREKTRTQLFNLSPHSHAEQASAGGEKSEEGKVSLVHSERLISPRIRAQTDANKQAGRGGIRIFCGVDDKNLSDGTLWRYFPVALKLTITLCFPLFVFPSLPQFSSPCPSLCFE